MGKQRPIDLSAFDKAVKTAKSKELDLSAFDDVVKKKEPAQPVIPTGTKPSKTGFEPFQTQVDTSTPSVILSDEQKQQREQERIGKRFETTLLNVPTKFGKVAGFMESAKKVKETLPEVPTLKPSTQMQKIATGEEIGKSLTEGTDFKELITDKLTNQKTGLQKQIENAQNAYRIYQGDELANQVQSYIPPEETLKIKEELGFGERMSNAGANFVNRLERFPYNTSLALGQTLTTLLGEDLGSNAYRQITSGGDAEFHRMVAYDELAKLDAETKFSKGLIESVKDGDFTNIVGGVVDAVGSLVSTVVTSAPTYGLGLYGDMVGGGLYDYNSTKAKRLGLTVDELYDTNQNEFFVPALINGAAAKLESLGLKGIKSAITQNIASPKGQKVALLFHGMNREGTTEWLQAGLDKMNKSLSEGKNVGQAVEESVGTLFSKEGANAYLMGVIASGAAIGGGRVVKNLVTRNAKKKAAESIQEIEKQQAELANPELSNESRTFVWENIQNNVSNLIDAASEDVDAVESLTDEQNRNIGLLNKKINALEIVVNDPAASEETKNRALESIKGIEELIDDIIAQKPKEVKAEIPQPTFDTEESIIAEVRESNRKFEAGEIDQYQWKQEQADLDRRAQNLIPTPEEIVEPLKTEEDAIQEQTAGEVSLQPEARIGEKVEERKPETEVETVTEEGKEEVKPIRQLGTGANVYFENDKYRVNDDLKTGKVLLNIQGKDGDGVPIANIEFDNANDAVKIANEISKVYPNGVPDALDIEKYVDSLKKELLGKEAAPKTVEELRTDEQAELKAAIPNAEQYLTDGKVDRYKIENEEDLKVFDEIYDKYDKLITPLLQKEEAVKAEPTKTEAPQKAKPRRKAKVATRLSFKKVIDLFNDISDAEGSAKKRSLSNARQRFLAQNPSIKYIDDNWKNISKQLEDKGLIKKEGRCP